VQAHEDTVRDVIHDQAGPAAGDLSPYPRHPLLPRLLLPRRQHPVGHHPAPQRRRPHPGRAQEHPGHPARRRRPSWANPIEAHFGPLRTFVIGNSNHPNHTVPAAELQAYLRWRDANTRHPDVLAAQRRERARIRSERHQRWGRPRPKARVIKPGECSWSPP
jgi:hypothetical protein